MNIIKTLCDKQTNTTPEDDQWNDRKSGVLSSPSWPWHKKNCKKTQTSSLKDFEKK